MDAEWIPTRMRRVKMVSIPEVMRRVPVLSGLLTNAEARAFVWLVNVARPWDGWQWWGVDRMIEELRISRVTMLRTLQRLRAIGLIASERTLQHGDVLPNGRRVFRTVVLRRVVCESESIRRVAVSYIDSQIAASIALLAAGPGERSISAALLKVNRVQLGVSLYGQCDPSGVSFCTPQGSHLRPDLKEDLNLSDHPRSGHPATRDARRDGTGPEIGAPVGADGRNASAVAAAGGERTDFAPGGASTLEGGARAAQKSDAPLVGDAAASGGHVRSREHREPGSSRDVSRAKDRAAKNRGVAVAVLKFHRDTLRGDDSKFRFSYAIEIVLARLAEGFTPTELCAAVEGARASKHNRTDPTLQTVRAILGTAERVRALSALAPKTATAPRAVGKEGVSGSVGGGGSGSGVAAMDTAKTDATLRPARCKNVDSARKVVDRTEEVASPDLVFAAAETVLRNLGNLALRTTN